MKSETRIDEIKKITDRDDLFMMKEIMWQGGLEKMRVHKIPLEYLLYNKYNGRILSRTKSLEAQGKELNPENEDDKKIIQDLLWYSKEQKNKKTLEDIRKNGQIEVGVITRDGIIIDGNRRAMLLNRVDGQTHFKAVVLPVALAEDLIEIKKLETSIQMGEDAKLGYNPIEKYLTTAELVKQGVELIDIAQWMGETETTIKEYNNIMVIMDEYLDYLDYNDIYTQLDGREDHFINLSKWINNFKGLDSARAFNGYGNDDVDDLKTVCFDYIRATFEGKNFRKIAKGNKENHFFGNKDVWSDFTESHFKSMRPINDLEEPINTDTNDLKATLDDRDTRFRNDANSLLQNNFDEAENKLRFKKHKDEPLKLVKSAERALETINPHSGAFKESEAGDKLNELRDKIDGMLKDTPMVTLQYIMKLLEDFSNLEVEKDDRNDISRELTVIQKRAFDLSKNFKR